MDMIIDFPGGDQVDAHVKSFTIETDQPPHSAAPSPFDIFLASIGTCAGFYVLRFCQQRGIETEGIRLIQQTEVDPDTHMVTKVNLDIQVPDNFPIKYKTALIRATNQCTVKKHLAQPPQINVGATIRERMAMDVY